MRRRLPRRKRLSFFRVIYCQTTVAGSRGMKEVDAALARAYALREQADRPEVVPPAPHLPAPGSQGLAGKPYGEPVRGSESARTTELQWPAVVLSLERECGDRFERMAELILRARQKQNVRVLLFTSCHRAEGRTTLMLTLSRALWRHPASTILVDGDLTGPMLAWQLALRPQVGLDDVVESGQALSDALVVASDDHLTILPMRSAVSRPRDFLASPGWTCTLARLRREYDLVLIDGGPLFTGLSAAALHRSVDAAVLVHHRGMSGERGILRVRGARRRGRTHLGIGRDVCVRSNFNGDGSPVYQAHFGLDRAPFGETVHPSAYVALASRDAVLRRLGYAFDAGQSAAVLFGPPGSGKTLLAQRLASGRAGSAVHITFPIVSASELVAQIAEALGAMTASPFSWNDTIRELRAHLAGLVANGERPLVIVDDADVITDRTVFEALRLLLNFASDGLPDLSLLLVGGAEVLLDLPRGLADRVAARCLITAFTESESVSYVLGRLAAAGAKSSLFSPESAGCSASCRRRIGSAPQPSSGHEPADRLCEGTRDCRRRNRFACRRRI